MPCLRRVGAVCEAGIAQTKTPRSELRGAVFVECTGDYSVGGSAGAGVNRQPPPMRWAVAQG